MPHIGDIIGYVRVLTADQDLSGQKDRLIQNGAVRVFDDVISGKPFNRPGLAALLDYARPNDTIAVIRLDRLGRSLKELLDTLDDLKARDANLISQEERIDTTSASGELVFHVFGPIAHFERRLISKRTKMGWRQIESMGEILTVRHYSKKQFQLFKISSTLENPSLKPPSTFVLADQQLTESSETRLSDLCSSFVPPWCESTNKPSD